MGPNDGMLTGRMEIIELINCPWCGEAFEIVIDTSDSPLRLVSDCEVCCRPFELVVECEPGEILSLEILGG